MKDIFPRICLGIVSVSFATLSFQLIPLSKQASSWNRCLKKTSLTLSKLKAVKKMDDQSIEVLSVMICNGAVFEPKFKANVQ